KPDDQAGMHQETAQQGPFTPYGKRPPGVKAAGDHLGPAVSPPGLPAPAGSARGGAGGEEARGGVHGPRIRAAPRGREPVLPPSPSGKRWPPGRGSAP